MNNNNLRRYTNVVNLFHTGGSEAYYRAKKRLTDELGEEEMERLSHMYEMEWESSTECQAAFQEQNRYDRNGN